MNQGKIIIKPNNNSTHKPIKFYSFDNNDFLFSIKNGYIEPVKKSYEIVFENTPDILKVNDKIIIDISISSHFLCNNNIYELTNFEKNIKSLDASIFIKTICGIFKNTLCDDNLSIYVSENCGTIKFQIEFTATEIMEKLCYIQYSLNFEPQKLKILKSNNCTSNQLISIKSKVCVKIINCDLKINRFEFKNSPVDTGDSNNPIEIIVEASSSHPIVKYVLYKNDVIISEDALNFSKIADIDDAGKYTIKVTDALGCSATAEAVLKVNIIYMLSSSDNIRIPEGSIAKVQLWGAGGAKDSGNCGGGGGYMEGCIDNTASSLPLNYYVSVGTSGIINIIGGKYTGIFTSMSAISDESMVDRSNIIMLAGGGGNGGGGMSAIGGGGGGYGGGDASGGGIGGGSGQGGLWNSMTSGIVSLEPISLMNGGGHGGYGLNPGTRATGNGNGGGGGSGYFNSNLITLKYGERSIKNEFDPSYSGEGIGAGKKSYISNDIPNGVINNGMTGYIPNVESNNLYGDCNQNGYAYIEILYP